MHAWLLNEDLMFPSFGSFSYAPVGSAEDSARESVVGNSLGKTQEFFLFLKSGKIPPKVR